MAFKYFVGAQADRYSFIRIPKILMTEKIFSGIQNWSKITYGFLLDRMQLSMKNEWVDEKGLVYVIYPLDEIQKDMGVSKKQVMEYLSELEEAGLLERKSRGPGLSDMIYLKHIQRQKTDNS